MVSALGANSKTIQYLKPDLWRGIDERAGSVLKLSVKALKVLHACFFLLLNFFFSSLQIIEVKFEKFDVERDNYCRYDHVSIFNGGEINDAKRIGKYCGDSPPA